MTTVEVVVSVIYFRSFTTSGSQYQFYLDSYLRYTMRSTSGIPVAIYLSHLFSFHEQSRGGFYSAVCCELMCCVEQCSKRL